MARGGRTAPVVGAHVSNVISPVFLVSSIGETADFGGNLAISGPKIHFGTLVSNSNLVGDL